jgi:hypothetical protein
VEFDFSVKDGILVFITEAVVDIINLLKILIPSANLAKVLASLFLGLGIEIAVKLLFQLVVVEIVLVDA